MRVITTTSQDLQRLRCSAQGNTAAQQSITLLDQLQLSHRNPLNCFAVKRKKRHDVIYAIEDFRTQKLPHGSCEVSLHRQLRFTQPLMAGVEPCAWTSKLR